MKRVKKYLNPQISTHTPHARRDDVSCTCFQQPRISTHTPHARRDIRIVHGFFTIKISTHTPHARRDAAQNRIIAQSFAFQLTRLMRGVTFIFKATAFFFPNFNSHASCEA